MLTVGNKADLLDGGAGGREGVGDEIENGGDEISGTSRTGKGGSLTHRIDAFIDR